MTKISQKYSNKCEPSLFASFKGVDEEKSRNVFRNVCDRLVYLGPPHTQGGSIAEPSPGKPAPNLSSNEMDGYRISTTQEDAVQKSLLPINLNAWGQIWMSRALKIFPSSEYAYSIFPIVLALFWDKGGRRLSGRNHCLRYLRF